MCIRCCRFGKGLTATHAESEELLGPMNAAPLPEVVRSYLSLDLNGRPLLRSFSSPDFGDDDDEAWLDVKDYVELPDTD